MQETLRELLETLLGVGERHPELYDTEVREQMGNALMEAFVRNRSDYRIPESFGMFSERADQEVRAAITKYLTLANAQANEIGLTRFHDRLAAVQDANVEASQPGYDYDEFFGHTPPEFYDEMGNVIRSQ